MTSHPTTAATLDLGARAGEQAGHLVLDRINQGSTPADAVKQAIAEAAHLDPIFGDLVANAFASMGLAS